jgi:glycerol-1-phosphate dehydrogenase [NAD(P)+]
MALAYDPAAGEVFWKGIEQIPGYPRGVKAPIQEMIFASDALFRLPEVLTAVAADRKRPVFVVMDTTPMPRGDDDLKPLVLRVLTEGGWNVVPVIAEPDASGQVHADMHHVRIVQSRLEPGAAVLSVGSGTVTDIAKHASFLKEQESGERAPLVFFPTANSVTAYSSNMAPLFVEGVKRTEPSRYPDALVADLETLADAPRDMTVAGVGDLLAFYVSQPDWYLAHRLGLGEGYNALPAALLGGLDGIVLAEAEGFHQQTLPAMEVLAKLNALGGLIMALEASTAPMSGLEHVLAHVIDFQAERTSSPMALHGTEVALGTVLASLLYRSFLSDFDPSEVTLDHAYPNAEEMKGRVEAAFVVFDPSGKAGKECWSDYQEKLQNWRSHRAEFQEFLAGWPSVRKNLEALTLGPERLVRILRAVGSPVSFEELTPPIGEQTVRFAFLNGPYLRKRITLGDLLVFLGADRESLWQDLWGRARQLAAS